MPSFFDQTLHFSYALAEFSMFFCYARKHSPSFKNVLAACVVRLRTKIRGNLEGCIREHEIHLKFFNLVKGKSVEENFLLEAEEQLDSEPESEFRKRVECLIGERLNREGLTELEKMLNGLEDPSKTSSFIQKVLYEDSRAGIAVVDLFVAVKSAKDNLDLLTRQNDQAASKIVDMSKETAGVKNDFRELLGKMHLFLEEMEAEAKLWESRILEMKAKMSQYEKTSIIVGEKSLNSFEGKTEEKSEEEIKTDLTSRKEEELSFFSAECLLDSEIFPETEENNPNTKPKMISSQVEEFDFCAKCGKFTKGSNDKIGCLGCVGNRLSRMTPQEVMSALMASALRGKHKGIFPQDWHRAEVIGYCQEQLEVQKSENSVNLSESTIEMICRICEVLADSGEFEKRAESTSERNPEENGQGSATDETESSMTDAVSELSLPEQKKVSCWSCGSSKTTQNCRKCGKDPGVTPVVKDILEEDAVSEGDSMFEEALSDPFSGPEEMKPRPSVTCMGDLTKADKAKKTVSTLTTANDLMSSWAGQVSEEIKSKLRNLKNKNRRVKMKKESDEFPAVAETMEFTITASTPVGMIDVTVRQFKDRRSARNDVVFLAPVTVTGNEKLPLPGAHDERVTDDDFLWSDESCPNSDSEPPEMASNSGEDEMEEFLDTNIGHRKDKKSGKSLVPPHNKGALKVTTLKNVKAPFFEIVKCYPNHEVEEIIMKKEVKVKTTRIEAAVEENSETVIIIPDKDLGRDSERRVVITDSSNDIVICIQVEVEEDEGVAKTNEVYVDYKQSSTGTQQTEDSDSLDNGESFSHFWLNQDAWSESTRNRMVDDVEESAEGQVVAEEEMKMFEPHGKSISFSEDENDETEMMEEEVKMIEPRGKVVTFSEELAEVLIEKEIREMLPENEREELASWEAAVLYVIMENEMFSEIHIPQSERLEICRIQEIFPKESEEQPVEISLPPNVELEKALDLIHKIENDVVDVKLSNAILILPHLESELRKHLQQKMKTMAEKKASDDISTDNFFSALEMFPEEESDEKSEESEERLQNLLNLLTDLEEAVKVNEYSAENIEVCSYSSSKIYKLLHALTNSIRELEDEATVVNLAETLDIASQLDTAVREFDSIVRKQPMDYVTAESDWPLMESGKEKWLKVAEESAKQEISGRDHLRNVRKKVFEMVEEEAMETEGRIEKDFDRIERLEKENDEGMKFIEAFLGKTEKRATELRTIKAELKNLSSVLSEMYDELLKRKVEATRKSEPLRADKETFINEPPTRDVSAPVKDEPVKDTVSGLLLALDNLKSRAMKKKEVCKEILGRTLSDRTPKKNLEKFSRSSRSSFTARSAEGLSSFVKQFKAIGQSSLYLSWTQPDGPMAEYIIGYQILLNGKLNQKVRNPKRLQAILHSVEISEGMEVQLYALLQNGPKVLLAATTFTST